ncbi:MBL fold metallo-hydrolase [Actinobacillus equuli]|uniref:MBL fold metallo-hydrolase n=1 Tax=Actinobacillus equuli TaxID=718 RepID=UPI002442F2C3|nr:MBL fold metallo-hydrolase [Actinobacillus equuli]WGE56559.1 MBL fold metallo-hydrolase [Actinobacillus equuli subsp. equuli]
MKLKVTLSALTLGLLVANSASALEYQHVRNATAKINYAGTIFLVDPYLATKGAYEGFAGTVNFEKRNPLIDMKQSAEDVIKGVQAVIVTHTHDDHWDKAAQEKLPKDLPIFVQNRDDATIIRGQGFKDVRVVGNHTEFNGVKLTRIKGGQHGTDAMYANPMLAEMLGDAMGFVMEAKGEKTTYVVGDTIWNQSVDNAIADFKPEVIVMNTGRAEMLEPKDAIIMGKEDVAKMRKVAPKAAIITVHMDAVNHATVSTKDMREFVKAKDLKQVAVPTEGEMLKY